MTEFERGSLNNRIQALAYDYLGRKLQLSELRLFPYMDYGLKNMGILELVKLNVQEYECIEKLAEQGFVAIIDENDRTMTLIVKKSFYTFLQEVLWESYVVKQ